MPYAAAISDSHAPGARRILIARAALSDLAHPA